MSRPDSHLWARYHETFTDACRNDIFEHHWDFISSRTARILKKMRGQRFLDDVLSRVAEWTLKSAIPRYAPLRDGTFRSFISGQLTSRIHDFLRTCDTHLRDKRWTVFAIEEARAELSHLLGHAPTDHEIAYHLAMSESEVIEAMSGREVQAQHPVVVRDEPDRFEELIYPLPQDQQEILRRYYVQGQTLAEIAKDLDIPLNAAYRWLEASRLAVRESLEG